MLVRGLQADDSGRARDAASAMSARVGSRKETSASVCGEGNREEEKTGEKAIRVDRWMADNQRLWQYAIMRKC